MALLTQNDLLNQISAVTLTRQPLSASDTFAFNQGSGQKLFLWNTTASLVTVTLTNATPNATITVDQRYGLGGTISTSSGKTVAVAASSSVIVDLDDYAAYLNGTGLATITGGTGVTAHLYV
jgi:hypothetical protein